MLTPRVRARTALRATRGYSSAAPKPTTSPLPSPAAEHARGAAPVRRGRWGRRVGYAALLTALFYGASVPVAQQNADYKKFFEERVYGGKPLLDYFADHDLRKELDALHLDDKVSHAAQQVRTGWTQLADKVRSNEHVQNTREEVEKRAEQLQQRVQQQIDELKSCLLYTSDAADE